MRGHEAGIRHCQCGARLARDNATGLCGPCQRKAPTSANEPAALPLAFWQSSRDLLDALDAWHMGRVIAAYRIHPHHVPPLSQEAVAGWMGITQTQLSRIESGEPITDLTKLIRWAQVLGIPEELLWFRLRPSDGNATSSGAATTMHRLEALRTQATHLLTTSDVSPASLDDWDQVVEAHGRATRFSPPGLLLADLAHDFADVQGLLERRPSLRAARHLTRLTAQLAGLINLTLIKLSEPAAARAWGRTARLAADEAGDVALSAWVRAQDAYTLFYGGAIQEAVTVAKKAQTIARRTPCVGAVLAAALEARAHAALGRSADANAAMTRAEVILAALGPDDVTPSAFGYNEAQLRFHQGNALTHLHDTRLAIEAGDLALDLYPTGDYLDRTLIHLDRADCLIHDGHIIEGVAHAADVFLKLPPQHRSGLIAQRARELAQMIPPRHQALPAVRDLGEVLALPAEPPEGGLRLLHHDHQY
ncbi:Helix-turn-helix protein [Frankia torreyi]|uniref:Helix-turn-helix protein n=2 Tax=Frankia torreyi TaxID=1856 RepID=A0A0D8B7M1_9ACTN|nr:Helix-turn-helix protein [Frankia torreyi]